jgi:hypothetical protein
MVSMRRHETDSTFCRYLLDYGKPEPFYFAAILTNFFARKTDAKTRLCSFLTVKLPCYGTEIISFDIGIRPLW